MDSTKVDKTYSGFALTGRQSGKNSVYSLQQSIF